MDAYFIHSLSSPLVVRPMFPLSRFDCCTVSPAAFQASCHRYRNGKDRNFFRTPEMVVSDCFDTVAV
ncbi:hypothetical protein NNO_1742 [Hydrogenimonas sp.]|nr:hypothetical protein NNO_1742 [Hydrogenimonas sp.]